VRNFPFLGPLTRQRPYRGSLGLRGPNILRSDSSAAPDILLADPDLDG
jgi:hypothetical protein